MLNLFRRGGAVGQILIGAIAFTIILVFALEFRPGRRAGPSKLDQECAVEVRGQCVPVKEFWAAYGLALPPLAEKEQIRRFRIVTHVLEGLIERELLVDDAERLKVSASEESVDAQLLRGVTRLSLPVADAPWFAAMLGLCRPSPDRQSCVVGTEGTRLLPVQSRKTKKFDPKIYERVVRHTTNRSPREFKEMQVRETVAARMRELIEARVQVSEGEAFFQYQQARSTATAKVAQVKADWFARFVVDASDAAVDSWALSHAQEVDEAWKDAKSSWKAGCQLVSVVEASFDADTSDDDKVLLRDKLEQAERALKGGDSFEQVVRQFSDGPVAGVQSSPRCLEDTAPEDLRLAIVQVKAGQVTPVLETDKGFFLVESHGVLEESALEDTGRRAVARSLMVQSRSTELATDFGRRLAEQVKSGANMKQSAEVLARAALGAKADDETPFGLQDPQRPDVVESDPFSIQSSPIPNAAAGQTPAAKAFAMEEGAVESVLTTEGVALMQLVSKSIIGPEDFATDKAKFMRMMRQAKGHEALVEYVARLRRQAEKETTINPELAKMDDEGAKPKR